MSDIHTGAGFSGEVPPAEANLADINKHLYAIFSPDFVKDHPDAWIEIATADPAAGSGKTGPKSARRFSVFELEKAAAYAVKMNKMGRNVYVGMALRQGETGPSGRATKANVITASRGWADFDKEGDDVRINGFLQQHGLRASEVIQTGSIPHIRLQVFFKLESPVTPDELETVNAALRDKLGGNGDGVQNCDRIMRLAGTVSYPPPNKVERGYVSELTKLISNPSALAYRPTALIGLLKGVQEPAGAAAGSNGTRTSGAASGPVNTAGVDADDGRNFWRRVNDLAFANLGIWVPVIFPDAKFQKGTGAYRISSESLGRKLEEDLSISPKGAKDFGVHDMGDARKGKRTAIDIVMEHGGAPGPREAAFWLCERCGVRPTSIGWDVDDIYDGSDILKADEAEAAKADEAWDPWHETPAPRLDLTLLPEVIREAATISARVSGADIDAFAISYLVGLTACGDTRLRITSKQHATDWSVPLLLWVLLVAPPSSMKSEVIKAARALAASLDMAERERYRREITLAEVGVASGGPKAEAKKAREEAVAKVALPRQRVCGDITIEKYIDILGANPGGVAMFRDELSGWLGSLGRYSTNGKDGADRAFYCALRDGTAHDRQRMSSPDVHLPHCAGGFFGAVQPDRLLDMELPTSDGLLQRFMPLIMREAQSYEDSDGVGDAKGLLRPVRDRLAALVPAMQRDPFGQTVAVPYKLTAEGAQLYQRFANDMRLAGRAQEPSREFGECLQKMGPMWLSMALLFHLIETDAGEEPVQVPFEAARRADAIIREYFIPHAEQFYDLLSGGSMRLRSVASAILRCPKDEIVLRDVVHRCREMRNKDRNEQIKLMQRFEAFGWLTRIDRHGTAHPKWKRTSGLVARFEEDLKREVAARAALTAAIKAEARARQGASATAAGGTSASQGR